MMRQLIRTVLASCVLGSLLQCSGQVQILGDGPSAGSGGGSAEAISGSGGAAGAALTAGADAGGAAGAPIRCDGGCEKGAFCLSSIDNQDSKCFAECDGSLPTWGESCVNTTAGGDGICRPFFDHFGGANHLLALCASNCDPLEPNCPKGYSCDVVQDLGSGKAPDPGSAFACVPVLVNTTGGAGTPCQPYSGYCAPGFTCPNRENPTCKRFCDLRIGTGCSAGEACRVSTDFPVDSPVGTCLPAKLSE